METVYQVSVYYDDSKRHLEHGFTEVELTEGNEKAFKIAKAEVLEGKEEAIKEASEKVQQLNAKKEKCQPIGLTFEKRIPRDEMCYVDWYAEPSDSTVVARYSLFTVFLNKGETEEKLNDKFEKLVKQVENSLNKKKNPSAREEREKREECEAIAFNILMDDHVCVQSKRVVVILKCNLPNF